MNECRSVAVGITQGDYQKAALNGALIALYVVPHGGAPANMDVKMRIRGATKEVIGVKLGAMNVANSHHNKSMNNNKSNSNLKLFSNERNASMETSGSKTNASSSKQSGTSGTTKSAS